MYVQFATETQRDLGLPIDLVRFGLMDIGENL